MWPGIITDIDLHTSCLCNRGYIPPPPWRRPRGRCIISLVNSRANTTSKRWHLWAIDLRFALDSTLWGTTSATETRSRTNDYNPLFISQLAQRKSAFRVLLHHFCHLTRGYPRFRNIDSPPDIVPRTSYLCKCWYKLQGYLAHKRQRPPETLTYDYA